jgi:hypothetical protein
VSKGPTKRRPTPRELDGIPGTVEPGFKEREIIEIPVGQPVREAMIQAGHPEEFLPRMFTMGPCRILLASEPAGAKGELLWHLSISTPSRHPTWDEIKVARYRLLPLDLVFAMILPPPDFYVNVPEQDHVMQLWEIDDPRAQWTTG